LREPHASIPVNPLLAEPIYLTKYIEHMGTGIRDMIDRCTEISPDPCRTENSAGSGARSFPRSQAVQGRNKNSTFCNVL